MDRCITASPFDSERGPVRPYMQIEILHAAICKLGCHAGISVGRSSRVCQSFSSLLSLELLLLQFSDHRLDSNERCAIVTYSVCRFFLYPLQRGAIRLQFGIIFADFNDFLLLWIWRRSAACGLIIMLMATCRGEE